MKVLFWIVKNKKNRKKESPIYCRITINGIRAEIFTGLRTKSSCFDRKRKRIKGTGELIFRQNMLLDQISNQVKSIYYNELENRSQEPTAFEIKAIYNAKKERVIHLYTLVRKYAEEQHHPSKEIRNKKHLRYIKIINKALAGMNIPKAKIKNCDNYFLDKMAIYIIEELKYSIEYTRNIFSFLKSALQFAYDRNFCDRMQVHDYKLPYHIENKIIYLHEWDVNKIMSYEFKPRLQKWADLFIVQCFTGLSYVDLRRLNTNHILKDTDGLSWIDITRKKVQSAECMIPVLNKVWDILSKYDFELPTISNQKYNKALKKIARAVGIKENLTTHVGRKTYGTLLLNKGVPIETVSKLLGHSSIRTTQQYYAKVLHMKVVRDLKAVIGWN